jgi:hypothetical protein
LTNEFGVTATITRSPNPIYTVEQDNILSPANIVYPEYVYNYAISPIRNAIRHLKTLFASYRNYIDAEIIFTNGTGNITAEGLLDSLCAIEKRATSESESIEWSDIIFRDPDNPSGISYEYNTPLYYAELIKFEYPVSYLQYKRIKAHPYGLIAYQCSGGAIELGWMEDFKYMPYAGMGEFVLRPAIITEELQEFIDMIEDGGLYGLATDPEGILIKTEDGIILVPDIGDDSLPAAIPLD